METCRDPESPLSPGQLRCLLRQFISKASYDEARRNLDARTDSVVRVAAISKLEDLPDDEAHPGFGPDAQDRPYRSYRSGQYSSPRARALFSPEI